MRPRVFVSSTYYDLKYLRERIELFLERFNFEPVLFESDKLTYEHGKPIDKAAYDEVLLCNMMVLVVGGRYGSPASNSVEVEDWQKKYDEDFVSITRKEYDTAVKNNIPVFILIDKNVYNEYQSFNDNRIFFEKLIKDNSIKTGAYRFSHVDSTNVFFFLDSLKQKPIKTFEKVDEIEDYLSNQFAGMFYLYLKKLKEDFNHERVLDSVSELNNAVKRMNEMVSGIGENLLGPSDFDKIVSKQQGILIDFIGEKIINHIKFKEGSFGEFKYGTDETTEMTVFLANLIFDYVLIKPKLPEFDKLKIYESFSETKKAERILIDLLNKKISEKYSNIFIDILEYWNILWTIDRRIEPVININDVRNSIVYSMAEEIESSILPF